MHGLSTSLCGALEDVRVATTYVFNGGAGGKNVDIECLCTLVVLCGAFAVITSAVSFPG